MELEQKDNEEKNSQDKSLWEISKRKNKTILFLQQQLLYLTKVLQDKKEKQIVLLVNFSFTYSYSKMSRVLNQKKTGLLILDHNKEFLLLLPSKNR